MRFVIDGQFPTATHQTKKVRFCGGKPVFYEPERLASARAYFMAKLAEHRPEKDAGGAIYLQVVWRFKRPKKCRPDEHWKTTRPDTDNLMKLLKDCMTDSGFWKDDSQVCREEALKVYGDEPKVEITVRRLD